MKKLEVRYRGWGEDWLLGTLADDGVALLFEYSPEALVQNLELSPLNLKLRAQAYGDFPAHQMRLPGLIVDALPDGWGLLLMDRLFRQRGIAPGPLDRLALMADRALGALSFEPPAAAELPVEDWSLLNLAQESHQVLAGHETRALLELLVAGGSPQGARPKALVHYDHATQHISTLPGARGEPWLVKFQARGEHKEACAIENFYANMARQCGIDMPATAYFDLSPKYAAFGIARFDRAPSVNDGEAVAVEGETVRVPIHSLAGLLHADFRVPAVDYTTFLRATRMLTRDEREVQKAFVRAVFNVICHNRDDHSKNFAYRLGRDRRWRLAPAYDLTYSDGPGGQHQTDVCGAAHNVSRAQLLQLGEQAGLDKIFANDTIERILETTKNVKTRAADYPIRGATIKRLASAIEQCRKAVG